MISAPTDAHPVTVQVASSPLNTSGLVVLTAHLHPVMADPLTCKGAHTIGAFPLTESVVLNCPDSAYVTALLRPPAPLAE